MDIMIEHFMEGRWGQMPFSVNHSAGSAKHSHSKNKITAFQFLPGKANKNTSLQAQSKTSLKSVIILEKINSLLRKRVSAPASRIKRSGRASKNVRGSMTLEAALLMSFFLLTVNLLFYFFYLMEFQVELQFALEKEVRKTVCQTVPSDWSSGVLLMRMKSELEGKETGITLGTGGIRLTENRNDGDEEILDVTAVFEAGPDASLLGPLRGRYLQRCRRRFWTGQNYIEQRGSGESEEDAEYVYVTPNGTVYHDRRDCTYLMLSVRAVSSGALSGLRNSDGDKYKPCETCMKGTTVSGIVYITDSGRRYHSIRNCSGLNRWVMKIAKTEAAGLGACTRCGR